MKNEMLRQAEAEAARSEKEVARIAQQKLGIELEAGPLKEALLAAYLSGFVSGVIPNKHY